MTPQEKRPLFMGSAEACEALGIPWSSRGNLHKVAGLPEPYQKLKMGKIWRADDIKRLAREREQARARRAEEAQRIEQEGT